MEYSARRDVIDVRVTQELIDFFATNHIYFSPNGTPRLKKGEKLSFGDSCEVEPFSGFYGGAAMCSIGVMSYIAIIPNKYAFDMEIGRYCSLGAFSIYGPRHPIEAATTSIIGYSRSHALASAALRKSADDDLAWAQISLTRSTKKTKIVLGNDIWMGAHATLNPGVTIGTGSIVAARSLVTKDIPPYEIWGGNPAKRIRPRFDEEIGAALLASEWWRYHPQDLATLPMQEPREFLDRFAEAKQGWLPFEPAKIRIFDAVKAL